MKVRTFTRLTDMIDRRSETLSRVAAQAIGRRSFITRLGQAMVDPDASVRSQRRTCDGG